MRNAVGKWITFVDSDDWLDVDYIEKLYESIPNIDKWKGLVVQGYSRVLQTTDCNIETICPTIKGLHSLSEEKDLLSVGKLDLTRFNFTVGKLVSKEIIEKYQVYFDEQVSFLEDLLFYLEYIKYIDSFQYLQLQDINMLYVIPIHYHINTIQQKKNTILITCYCRRLMKFKLYTN